MFVGQGRQGQHQCIGLELARGQAHQIQVALELAVKLLGGAPALIEENHLLCIHTAGIQAGPPAFQHQDGNQQRLTPAVFRALYQLNHAPAPMASLSKAPFNHFIEQRHPLAWAHFDKAPLRLGAHFPVVGVLLAGIPLDQVVDLFPGQILPVGRRIVGAIKGDQQGLIAGKRPGSGQNAVEKEEKVLLAVLIARTQFQPHAPSPR